MAKKLINLSDKTLDKIKKIAFDEKRNVNQQISYILEEYIGKLPKQEKSLLNINNNNGLKVGAGFC